MKTFFFFIAMSLTMAANAQQVVKVALHASGLTCSMCSNSINKSLKTIDFVDKVDANIQSSTFEISFRPGSNVDFETLKKKVEDAGFFVSRFVATIRFDNVPVKSSAPVNVGDKTFYFVNAGGSVLNGERSVRILNKGFVSSKEYKKNPVNSTAAKVYYASV